MRDLSLKSVPLIFGSTQWFNEYRTSRTNPMKSTEKCVAFWAFDGTGNIVGVPCKKWSCEKCQKLNAQLWAWRAQIELDNDDNIWFMWTLTLGSNYTSVRKAYADLKKLWDRLRQRVHRDYEKKYGWGAFNWPYLAFVEGQPERNYMPHFHIISALPAPYRLKDFAVACGFGYQAEERLINGKGAAAYVAKYSSKGAGMIPKDFRRVRASQGWADLPDVEKKTLFVKGKKENLTDYFLRVSAETGVSVDSLWTNWKLVKELD